VGRNHILEGRATKLSTKTDPVPATSRPLRGCEAVWFGARECSGGSKSNFKGLRCASKDLRKHCFNTFSAQNHSFRVRFALLKKNDKTSHGNGTSDLGGLAANLGVLPASSRPLPGLFPASSRPLPGHFPATPRPLGSLPNPIDDAQTL
jgi:hypothetical protein